MVYGHSGFERQEMRKSASILPGGNGYSYGMTTNETIGAFFCKLMEAQRTEKLDDDELAKALKKEFPKRQGDYLKNMRLYRSLYNNGKWNYQNKRLPDFIVPKYVNRKPVINHPGPRSKRETE